MQGGEGETSHMASLWRPDAAPLCGYERGSLASQDAMDTLLHLEPQDAAVEVSTLRMATLAVACGQCLRRPLHHSSPFEAGHTAQDWARACLEASELTWREALDTLHRGRFRQSHLQVLQQSYLGRSLGHAEPHVRAKGAC